MSDTDIDKLLTQVAVGFLSIGDAKAAIEQKLTDARIDELNRIVKAEDYVWTASNEDNQYEFNVEIYATRRILDLQASKEGK